MGRLICGRTRRLLAKHEIYRGRSMATVRASVANRSSITVGVKSPYFLMAACSMRKSAMAGFLGSNEPCR